MIKDMDDKKTALTAGHLNQQPAESIVTRHPHTIPERIPSQKEEEDAEVEKGRWGKA